MTHTVFSSTLFLFVFLPVTLLLYFICPFRLRNLVLLVVSLIFYGWGEPVYVLLMIASTAMDYLLGYGIEMSRHAVSGGKHAAGGRREKTRRLRQGKARAKCLLIISIVLNLGTLFIFKYLDFAIENLRVIPALAGLPLTGLTLPIGISFYTFQKMSYVIDVYRGDGEAQRNLVSFGAYVTMFPQLIAGPIVKYRDIDAELRARTVTLADFAEGVRIFAVGLAKKILLANAIGVLWDTSHAVALPSMTVLGSWLGVIAFSFQIYFDFSGYSDMAVGLGRMFGFHFLRNFEYPYTACSVTDFWRRWHISLSTWFREYLYIPLGGNRKGKLRWLANILIVWMATGIWHGASWNFLLWGLYYALLLMAEKLFLLKVLEKLPKLFTHAYAVLTVLIGWTLFASDSLSACLGLLSALFGSAGGGLFGAVDLYHLRTYLPLLLILCLASLPVWKKRFLLLPARAQSILSTLLTVLGLVLCTMSIVDSTYNPFLYFRF